MERDGRPAATTALADRAAGALLGAAAGEAFGAREPGRWGSLTDAALAAAHVGEAELRGGQAVDRVAAAWSRLGLAAGSTDGCAAMVGVVPAALARLRVDLDPPAQSGFACAAGIGSWAGGDADTAEACALWCSAIWHAVSTGQLDVRVGLAGLTPDRAELWTARLAEAESRPAGLLCRDDSGTVQILQAAWSVAYATPVPAEQPRAGSFRVQHLQAAVKVAAAAGGSRAAAVAGTLLGAAYGATAVPASWRRRLHGPNGGGARDLEAAAGLATGSAPPEADYSLAGDLSVVGRHPHDPSVWLGGYKALRSLPPGVDAVVSLCPVAAADLPAGVEHVEFRLVDSPIPGENPNLAFVLHDAADLVEAWRAERRTVLIHGVRGMSRVPAAACAYGFRKFRLPASAALADIERVLLGARVNDAFREALTALSPAAESKPMQRPTGGRVGRSGRSFRGPGDWPEGKTTYGRY